MEPRSYRALTSWKNRLPPPFAQGAFAFRLGQRADELGECAEVDRSPGLDGFDAQRDGQVGLAAARLAQEVHDLGPLDEAKLGQRHDPVAVQRGLEAEVEARQRLDREQAPHLEGGLDAAAFPQGQLLAEQQVDGVQSADFAALKTAQQMIQHLQRARHAQAHEMLPDPVRAADGHSVAAHAAIPSLARRRATAS